MRLSESWYHAGDGVHLCIWCLREASLCLIVDPCGDRESFEDERVSALAGKGRTDNDARRRERIHWAIFLWNLVEEANEPPSNEYERGYDHAYRNVAGWLMGDMSRGPFAGDNDGFDLLAEFGVGAYPDLPEFAEKMAGPRDRYPSKHHRQELDRALAVIDS